MNLSLYIAHHKVTWQSSRSYTEQLGASRLQHQCVFTAAPTAALAASWAAHSIQDRDHALLSLDLPFITAGSIHTRTQIQRHRHINWTIHWFGPFYLEQYVVRSDPSTRPVKANLQTYFTICTTQYIHLNCSTSVIIRHFNIDSLINGFTLRRIAHCYIFMLFYLFILFQTLHSRQQLTRACRRVSKAD